MGKIYLIKKIIKWGFIMSIIISIILFLFLGIPGLGCRTGFLTEKKNQAIENLTEMDNIIRLTEKNASCTSFAAFITAQQAAKSSDQNLAESTINVCNTIIMQSYCSKRSDGNQSKFDACMEYFWKRK